jgi:serine/threonine protein kinase
LEAAPITSACHSRPHRARSGLPTVHRDIKPANIILGATLAACLTSSSPRNLCSLRPNQVRAGDIGRRCLR